MEQKVVAGLIYFTKNGEMLAERLKAGSRHILFEEKPKSEELSLWIQKAFRERMPLIFISAMGIAVRAIAPFVRDKTWDSPVIVLDETGKNVIPILSGHLGGANAIAKSLAEVLGADLVLTTATDLQGVFAVDVFAAENGFYIPDKEGIKEISSKLLKGEIVKMAPLVPVRILGDVPSNVEIIKKEQTTLRKTQVDVWIDERKQDGFTLFPRKLVLGMGCKKGKTFEELLAFISSIYDPAYLREDLYAIATVEAKENEVGLIKLARYFGGKFLTYSAVELESIEGEFPASAFVEETVGVSNVCERAAIMGAGLHQRELELEKTTGNGMTLAAAKRKEFLLRF